MIASMSVLGSEIKYWDLKSWFCDCILRYEIWILWLDTIIWNLNSAICNRLVQSWGFGFGFTFWLLRSITDLIQGSRFGFWFWFLESVIDPIESSRFVFGLRFLRYIIDPVKVLSSGSGFEICIRLLLIYE